MRPAPVPAADIQPSAGDSPVDLRNTLGDGPLNRAGLSSEKSTDHVHVVFFKTLWGICRADGVPCVRCQDFRWICAVNVFEEVVVIALLKSFLLQADIFKELSTFLSLVTSHHRDEFYYPMCHHRFSYIWKSQKSHQTLFFCATCDTPSSPLSYAP